MDSGAGAEGVIGRDRLPGWGLGQEGVVEGTGAGMATPLKEISSSSSSTEINYIFTIYDIKTRIRKQFKKESKRKDFI